MEVDAFPLPECGPRIPSPELVLVQREEKKLHHARILAPIAERLTGSVPVPGPEDNAAVEAHGNRHQVLPLAAVAAVAFDQIPSKACTGGFAIFHHVSVKERCMVRAELPVAEELGAAPAMLWKGEKDDAGPKGIIHVHAQSRLLVVTRHGDAKTAMARA